MTTTNFQINKTSSRNTTILKKGKNKSFIKHKYF